MMLAIDHTHAAPSLVEHWTTGATGTTTLGDGQSMLLDSSLACYDKQQAITQHPLEQLVKSFPTPDMSPLDSADKQQASNGQQQQQQQQQHFALGARLHEGLAGCPEGSPGAPSSAVDELIANFGDQSSVLKSVQPPYKYRMIVSTSVASSMSDQTIEREMRRPNVSSTGSKLTDNPNQNSNSNQVNGLQQQQQLQTIGLDQQQQQQQLHQLQVENNRDQRMDELSFNNPQEQHNFNQHEESQ